MDPAQTTFRSTLRSYLRLLGAVRPYAGQLALAIGCMIVLAAATAAYAYLIGPLLKFLSSGGELGGQEFAGLVPGLDPSSLDRERLLRLLPVLILALALLKGLAFFGQFYLMGRIGQKVVADLREQMFTRLTLLGPAFFLETPTGSIISRFTNDVYAVEQAVTYSVATYLRDSLEVLVLCGLAFALDWQLFLITFVGLPIALVPIVHFGQRLKGVSLESQITLGSIADRVHEAVTGMRVVQVFGAEAHERRRFSGLNRAYLQVMLRSFAVRAAQSPVMELLGAAGLSATIWYAGSRMASGSLDPAHFISFFAAVLMIYTPLKNLGRIGNTTIAGVAGAERVFELVDQACRIEDAKGARPLTRFERTLAFEDVWFGYAESAKPVLRGVGFEARRGEVVAVVGPSGAGKSTLVNLIPRFFDPTGGRLLLDGRDLRTLTLASLRAQIATVSQEVILFNDTLADNICYGPLAVRRDALQDVARKAHLLDFIESLPDKFETRIGEGGLRLSGGQRQRVAIARALLKDAPILLLDEATSALDAESEAEVQAALRELMRDRTTVVIAHRLSTVRHADRILVLDQGRIVEEGRHDALLKKEGVYRRLVDLQLTA